MQGLAILAIVLILLGMIGYHMSRNRRFGKSERRNAPATTYHAVAISPSRGACSKARELWNIRYLSKDAPRLPLTDCGARPCHCRYIHYDDRRTEERRLPFGVARDVPPLSLNTERRQMHRRRARSKVSA